jgi:Asp-tRNA(Asn)/Glu-tRNA(Gln) amidotransferase A subunit family amidase
MSELKKGRATRRQFLGVTAAGATLAVAGCSNPPEPEPLANIRGAEELMGLSYSDEERAQIAEGIDDQLDTLRALRAHNHPNSLPTAQVFDPRLKSSDYGTQENILDYPEDVPALPGNEEAIAFAPLVHLAHWIRTGAITSGQLTALYLRRIAQLNPLLECFITVTSELAMEQAAVADREIGAGNYRSPLHGIPYGVKDLMDTQGIRTTWGAGPYKDRVAEGDAHIVTLLRNAGAVLLGKTTCGALAWGDVWFDGVTKNPWHLLEGSSGSSAGSASATAAGLVGFAIGTETLGSIVSPANRCGATGLRPTYGRVGRSGTMALCWSLDKIGPICRGVEDTALVLGSLNGEDLNDPGNFPHGFAYDGNLDISALTVGYDPKVFEGDQANAIDVAALEAMQKTGVKMKEISLPTRDVTALGLQLNVEAAAAFEELTLSGRDALLRRQITNAWPNRFREARLVSAVDLIQVDRLRRLVMQDMDKVFDDCDAVFGPNYAASMLLMTNYTGHPQLTLRAGFEQRSINLAWGINTVQEEIGAHMPRNVSLWAPLYQEGRIIAIGKALEKELRVAFERPRLEI